MEMKIGNLVSMQNAIKDAEMLAKEPVNSSSVERSRD
jgi:hypothetical protein